jgi:hypothetical protein
MCFCSRGQRSKHLLENKLPQKVANTSDCTTCWITGEKEAIVEMDPNSVLLYKRVEFLIMSLLSNEEDKPLSSVPFVPSMPCSKHAMFCQEEMVKQFATSNKKKQQRKKESLDSHF